MNDVFEAFQGLLRSAEPNYSQFRRQLMAKQAILSEKELVRSHILMRLNLALDGYAEQRAGTSDVSILLRQVIRAYERRLEVKRSLWQVLSSREQAFGLRQTAEREPDMVELFADPWYPRWLAGVSNIDQLQQRRYDAPVIGDGLLYAMSGGKFATYQSEAQKAAVQACLFAPPGSTLLVTLPTGGGKSLCMQLPAWQESRGGRIKGGTTLAIVPTVSLALDQEERAQSYFADAPSMEYKPCSLTGSTLEVVRTTIRSGLLNGTLPILFTSPESLMNSSLYQICLEAARRGTINRLVIDEAHLVETWGAGFRTEFQFLSTYRSKLLEASQGQLRTLLLSATVSEECAKLLKKLFSSQGSFYSVRADRLRPEISYWFHYAYNETIRQAYVMDALCHLPRPVILYVVSPDDTKMWLKLLRGQGFERIAAFSGETDADERRTERLLRQSGLPREKTLRTFQVTRLSPALQLQLERLKSGAFLESATNVIAVGKPGVGKSHALAAVAHELVVQGHAVLWCSTAGLVQRLLAAKRDLRLPQELARLDKFACVILDDIGYVQHDRDEMEVLFTFLAERYEHKSVMLTTNLVFSEWQRIFKDPMTTLAAIDRVVHHSVILDMMSEESYRAEVASQHHLSEATGSDPLNQSK